MKTRDKGRELVGITVRMPRELWEEFREACYRHSVSMQEIAVEAIREKMKGFTYEEIGGPRRVW